MLELFAVDKNSGAYQLGQILGFITLLMLGGSILWKVIMSGMSGGRRGEGSRSDFEERQSAKRRRKGPPVWSLDKIDRKTKPTVQLLKLVSEADDFFEPKCLRDSVQDAFEAVQDLLDRKVQLEDLERECTGPCLDTLEGRVRNREDRIHQLLECDLDRISLVHFAATGEDTKHTFSAIVTAIRDRGKSWQEVWTFRRTLKRWKLSKLQSTEESDALLEQCRIPSKLASALRKDGEVSHLLEIATTE